MNKMNVIAEQKPIISIIVPVYNAEQYLASCLNSLLAQSFDNIEILCINDGSKDNSLEILKTYKKINHKIRVFSQENSGPAKARNVGLENAQGEFIMFCDADDTYEPNMCEEMYRTISDKNVDVVMCNTHWFLVDNVETNNSYAFNIEKSNKTDICPNHRPTNVWLWNKIFKKSIIDCFNIRFPNFYLSDDNLFIWEYFSVSQTIFFLNKKLYNHYTRDGSIWETYISDNIKYKDLYDHIYILKFLYDFLLEHGKLEENFDSFKEICVNEIFNTWSQVPDIYVDTFIQDLSKVLFFIKLDDWDNFPKWNIYDYEIKCLIVHIKNLQIREAKHALDHWLYKNKRQRRRTCNAVSKLVPAFEDNNVALIFNCDAEFYKYFSVTLESIIQNSTSNNNYDLIVLHTNISWQMQEVLLDEVNLLHNFSLRFVNVENYVKKYGINQLRVLNFLKVSAYYRLLIPQICVNYHKVLYLDSDLIVKRDIAELYDLNIVDYACAAVKDFSISNISSIHEFQFSGFNQYASDVLNIHDISNYFNSGVLLMNVDKIVQCCYFDSFLSVAKKNTKYFNDQNVFNSVLAEDVLLIDDIWNFQINYGSSLILLYLKDRTLKNIGILHYCSPQKPWNTKGLLYGNCWWQYARKSPFYEIILKDFLACKTTSISVDSYVCKSQFRQILTYKKDKLKYLRYKILSKITFGKMREHYKRKKRELKMRLKEVKKMLNSK